MVKRCGRYVVRFLFVLVAVALVLTIMICTLTRQSFLVTLGFTSAYTLSIGILTNVLVPATWDLFGRMKAPLPWLARAVLLVSLAVTGTMLGTFVLMLLGLVPHQLYWREFAASAKFALIVTLVTGMAITAYESLRAQLQETTLALRTRELEKERALKLATEARLASLESRIHPHFLFNALNSISALIRRDPERAESLVERMAALLRFSLDSRHGGLVPLGREMKIVKDYLEIERARFGTRLRYSIDVPAALETLRIPPLAVQTLVENSVKYVVSTSLSGGEIAVRAVEEAGALTIDVIDSGPGFEPEAAPSGHGIDNVRERLAALFGDQAALTAGRRDNIAFVRIVVPQTEPARVAV